MANKRTLKKIVNAIAYDVVDECMYQIDTTSGKEEELLTLLNDAIKFRNEAIVKINASRRTKDAKAAIKSVAASLEESTFQFIDRINKLA